MKYQSSSTHCSKVIYNVKDSDRMINRIMEWQNDKQDKNKFPVDLSTLLQRCFVPSLTEYGPVVIKSPFGTGFDHLVLRTSVSDYSTISLTNFSIRITLTLIRQNPLSNYYLCQVFLFLFCDSGGDFSRVVNVFSLF